MVVLAPVPIQFPLETLTVMFPPFWQEVSSRSNPSVFLQKFLFPPPMFMSPSTHLSLPKPVTIPHTTIHSNSDDLFTEEIIWIDHLNDIGQILEADNELEMWPRKYPFGQSL